MLLLSLVAGVAAVVLGYRWLSEQASGTATQIVVAARDIELGQPLDATMLTLAPWPAGAVPQGAFKSAKELEGRVVKSNTLRGEPVLEGKLAPPGTKGGLSALIPEGKRAITVRVNEVVGVAGFALPGNFVDVLVNTQDDTDKPISKIVLERILVLAVAQEASRDETKPRVVNAVTLEVTPEQAERLDLARSVGNLSLVLRNQLDRKEAGSDGARKNELLSGRAAPQARAAQPPAAAPKPAAVRRAPPPQAAAAPALAPAPLPEPPARIEVIRGVARSTVEL
jgi:pilus assembly protein CpaB